MEQPGTNSAIKNNDAHIIVWQRKIMLWTIGVPSGLILIFIILATVQLKTFETHIYQSDSLTVTRYLPRVDLVSVDTSINNKLGYLKLYALAKMEEYSINRRYNQAGEILVSGIYTKYLGFFTGMILAIVGAVFIISKIREDTTNLEGTVREHINFKLASSSPGIVFGVLGTLLMATTIFKNVESNVTDTPLFLNYQNVTRQRNGRENAALDDLENQREPQHIDSTKAKNANP